MLNWRCSFIANRSHCVLLL